MTKSISEINERAALDILDLIVEIETINSKRASETVGLIKEENTANEDVLFSNAFNSLSGMKFHLSEMANARLARENQIKQEKILAAQKEAEKQAIIAEYLAEQENVKS